MNPMKEIKGDNFDMVSETFYFDSKFELLLNSFITINVKNNDSVLFGNISSCEKLDEDLYRIGVKLTTSPVPESKESPLTTEKHSPPIVQSSDTM
jgi:hypothetical protein